METQPREGAAAILAELRLTESVPGRRWLELAEGKTTQRVRRDGGRIRVLVLREEVP
jgi:hypothetical protein